MLFLLGFVRDKAAAHTQLGAFLQFGRYFSDLQRVLKLALTVGYNSPARSLWLCRIEGLMASTDFLSGALISDITNGYYNPAGKLRSKSSGGCGVIGKRWDSFRR
ncbi:MAG TPA: hypothetical protein VK452_11225 [Dissulfurispiraceae bacterium]|nr:hypothetical protein [Dissulfurispiraceae bacterium]